MCLHLLQNRNDCDSTKLQEFWSQLEEFQETRRSRSLADTVHAKSSGSSLHIPCERLE
jgi:hypothetical protein